MTEQQKFYGAINLKELIIARRDDLLENLVVTSYPYVYAEENIDECIEELKDYSEDSIRFLTTIISFWVLSHLPVSLTWLMMRWVMTMRSWPV